MTKSQKLKHYTMIEVLFLKILGHICCKALRKNVFFQDIYSNESENCVSQLLIRIKNLDKYN